MSQSFKDEKREAARQRTKKRWEDPEYRARLVAAHSLPPELLGDPSVPGTSAYRKLHKELVRTRGRADSLLCGGCGKPAKDWSHRHGTDRMELTNYDPRCAGCHMAYDRVNRSGSKHHNAKLTEDIVRKIRKMYVSGEYTQPQLAILFNVNFSTVNRAIQRETWAHVD